MQPRKSEDEKVRSAKWYLPVAAIAALVFAYVIGTYVVNNRQPEFSANPADQTSATGGSGGETGRNTIHQNTDAEANPGAVPAPAKAPNNGSSAADTQPDP